MRKTWKILLIVAAAVLVLSGALVTCAVVFMPAPVHESVTVEAGSKAIPLHQFPKEGKSVELVTNTTKIDLNTPGTHVLEFLYKEKIYSATLEIVDTVAPVGTPVEHTIFNDQTLDASEFVMDIQDVTGVTLSFAQEPDFTKVGEQTVTVNLTDTSGNVGAVTAKLTVVADTVSPVFSPMEDLVVNLSQSVSYRKNVTATDDRDGEIPFQIDSGAVNLEEAGTYTITYTATDSSGNTTTVERKIHVMSELVVNQELVDEMAKEILAKILTDGMTPHEKIKKIYNHVRYTMAYSHSPEKDIPSAAYKAMTKHKGDCYNHFAYAKVLLDNAGIDNIPVERYGGKTSHFWLLVNIGTGWYHYDCTPQSEEDPFRCFMKTDAQVKAYARSRSDGRRDYYDIDYTKYPELATEKYNAD